VLQLHSCVQPAHSGAYDQHREPGLRRLAALLRAGPLERAGPRVDGQFLQPQVKFLGRDLGTDGQADAVPQPLRGADRELAGAGVPVGLEERRRLGPDQGDIVLARDVPEFPVHADDLHFYLDRTHFLVAGQLVEQAPQGHRVRVLHRSVDFRVARPEDFRTVLRHRCTSVAVSGAAFRIPVKSCQLNDVTEPGRPIVRRLYRLFCL